jgi:hypothetical protein
MIIDYKDIYLKFNLKINGSTERKQQKLTKNILKLQEWFMKGC